MPAGTIRTLHFLIGRTHKLLKIGAAPLTAVFVNWHGITSLQKVLLRIQNSEFQRVDSASWFSGPSFYNFLQKATRTKVAMGPRSKESKNQLSPLLFLLCASPAFIKASVPKPTAYPPAMVFVKSTSTDIGTPYCLVKTQTRTSAPASNEAGRVVAPGSLAAKVNVLASSL